VISVALDGASEQREPTPGSRMSANQGTGYEEIAHYRRFDHG
jgi:hypothetical protein